MTMETPTECVELHIQLEDVLRGYEGTPLEIISALTELLLYTIVHSVATEADAAQTIDDIHQSLKDLLRPAWQEVAHHNVQ